MSAQVSEGSGTNDTIDEPSSQTPRRRAKRQIVLEHRSMDGGSSKRQAASSLACARRGWVNIDMDKIECESCGAHVIFTALTSWSPAEVANAGEAFDEQLDEDHISVKKFERGMDCHLPQDLLISLMILR